MITPVPVSEDTGTGQNPAHRPSRRPHVPLADICPSGIRRRMRATLGPMNSDNSTKWYYDTATGDITQGKESGWNSRLGPYDTAEEARRALETARARTDAADEWDRDDD